jgi:dihydrodipicolinate reductase
MVDFTVARSAEANIKSAIAHNVRFVVGTTGMTASAVESIMNEAAHAGWEELLFRISPLAQYS